MRPRKFAKRLDVSVKTLHRWDESGKLKAKRTLSNHRYYSEDDIAVACMIAIGAIQAESHCLLLRIFSKTKNRTQKPASSDGGILLSSWLGC